MPLSEKVEFKARLQRGNRVQIPKIIRWRFKLEPWQILKVTVTALYVWQADRQVFFARMSKDGRIAIPYLALAILSGNKDLVGHVMVIILEPS